MPSKSTGVILVDLNVLLDVIQKREPHYRASAAVLERVVTGASKGTIPAHTVTTVHFIANRYATRASADHAVEWMLEHFEVAGIGEPRLRDAMRLGWPDFEDAVVAAEAATLS